jgi:predicted permease
MPHLFRDFTGSFRALRATPATTLAAVLTIALGTGANTAMFAIAYGVLLRPLPCPEPARVVVVSFHAPNGTEFGIPLTAVEDWQRRVRAFDTTGAYSVTELTVRGIGEPRLVRTGLVTSSFFETLGVPPRAGRAPSTSDPDEWMILGARLAGELPPSGRSDADKLGSLVTAGDLSRQVTAVMPAEFGFPAEDVAAWMPAAPMARIPLASGKDVPRSFRLMGRLKDGVSLDQAREDAQRAFLEIDIPSTDRGSARLRSLDDVLFGKVRPALNALMAAAILVLLVACGNVATLLVSRAVGRRRDLAVRLSLGASPWRLVRGAFAESSLVAAAGSALGVAIALACVRVFVRTATGIVPRLDAIRIDLPVLAATLFAGCAVTLICGLAPAIHAIRADPGPAFHGSRVSASRGVRLTRRALIVLQIAIAIVLLCGAGLIGRTLFGLMSDHAGAEPERALVVKLVLAD